MAKTQQGAAELKARVAASQQAAAAASQAAAATGKEPPAAKAPAVAIDPGLGAVLKTELLERYAGRPEAEAAPPAAPEILEAWQGWGRECRCSMHDRPEEG